MDFLRYPVREIKLHQEGLVVKQSLPSEFLKQSFLDTEVDSTKSAFDLEFKLQFIPGGQIQIHGNLNGTIGLICQRCIDPVSMELSSPIHAYFLPPSSNLPSDESDSFIDLESAEYVNYEGDFVDVAPYIAEQLILSIPMTVLCKDDCLGLCPICGENRNLQPCACKETPSLSPFAKLKDFSLPS